MGSFLLAFVCTLALTEVSIPLLRRAQLIDRPNPRSSHSIPTPSGGGIPVLVAIIVSLLLTVGAESLVFLMPAVLLGALGLIDDRWSLTASLRMSVQAMVALAAAMSLVQFSGQTLAGSWTTVSIFLGAVAFIGYVNAFNFMDGVNGISALNAVVCGAWFAYIGQVQAMPVVGEVGAVLAGAAVGFFPRNAGSRVFLGDVGSYSLGALIASTSLGAWLLGAPFLVALAPTVIYLADTGTVVVRRALRGAPVTEAHQEHVYQRLVKQGWSHLRSAAWSAAAAAVVLLVVATLQPWGWAALCAGLVVCAYLATPRVTASGKPDRTGIS